MVESLNQIVYKFLFMFIAMFLAFTGLIIYLGAHSQVLIIFIICALAYLILGSIFILVINNRIARVLESVSKAIQGLIDGKGEEEFSTIEDNILSKLQFQLSKLSRILIKNQEKTQKERDNIQELISDISHQLKTPLTNLNMYTSFLFNYDLDEEKKVKFKDNIQGQIEKLNWLMDALIKMSRLESGIINIRKENGVINQTIEEGIMQVMPEAHKKNMTIEFIQDRDIFVEHDKKWTGEAIFNIIHNAVKYGYENGNIKLKIQEYEIFTRIDVEDNGPGMYESEINNIFKRFYRGENVANIEGVGIGLYLVREIISKQGGYVKVSSIVGKGSTFSLFLPG